MREIPLQMAFQKKDAFKSVRNAISRRKRSESQRLVEQK